jgi:hypothetical protein
MKINLQKQKQAGKSEKKRNGNTKVRKEVTKPSGKEGK